MRTERIWLVRAANMSATYKAGLYCAATAQEACEMAREDYRKSDMNRSLKDLGSFRFWAVRAEVTDE